MGPNLWQSLQAFKPLIYWGYLLEEKTMEMFSMGEWSKNKHKFGGVKVCEAEEVKEFFINPKIENGVLGNFFM